MDRDLYFPSYRSGNRPYVAHEPTTTSSMRLSNQATSQPQPTRRSARVASRQPSNAAPHSRSEAENEQSPPRKRRKVTVNRKRFKELHLRLFSCSYVIKEDQVCLPHTRQHSWEYHIPLLLAGSEAVANRRALLKWFDVVCEIRAMPWRQKWIDPNQGYGNEASLRSVLERRAYEVWISEIMLQQTQVAVVRDYWTRWMKRWPTIRELARANPEDVLASWRGLGYYSRATRIHEAAKFIVRDPKMRGLMPATAKELEAWVPGVGRYTAGAISAIVFGQPEAMVDGNVLRVLSRQFGIYGNVKTNQTVIDTIWAGASALVRAVVRADGEVRGEKNTAPDKEPLPISDLPGRWGQALMDLGSTVCTPKPNCSACPITSTCRVYSEGLVSVSSKASISKPIDIEDACDLCEVFEDSDGCGQQQPETERPRVKISTDRNGKPTGSKPLTRANFSHISKTIPAIKNTADHKRVVETVAEFASKFPAKVAKKLVREEESVVCAIRHPNGSYLIRRRPPKGLLAGLWELPSTTISASQDGKTARGRAQVAMSYASSLVAAKLKHVGELGSVPWRFSHIRLTMHVHLFVAGRDCHCDGAEPSRWSHCVEDESMGTGMGKCWALVKESQEKDSER